MDPHGDYEAQIHRWQVGTALYILGLISYQGALTCELNIAVKKKRRGKFTL